MLKYPSLKNSYYIRAKSGFYFDFFTKKVLEVFIRNFLIYSALFFGEKFLIEFLTKKILTKLVDNTNKIVGWSILNQKLFFVQALIVIFYILFVVNMCTFFM